MWISKYVFMYRYNFIKLKYKQTIKNSFLNVILLIKNYCTKYFNFLFLNITGCIIKKIFEVLWCIFYQLIFRRKNIFFKFPVVKLSHDIYVCSFNINKNPVATHNSFSEKKVYTIFEWLIKYISFTPFSFCL